MNDDAGELVVTMNLRDFSCSLRMIKTLTGSGMRKKRWDNGGGWGRLMRNYRNLT